MTEQTKTPETDAKESETVNQKPSTHAHYGWKHARRLERERDAAREALRECVKYLSDFDSEEPIHCVRRARDVLEVKP